MPISCLGQTDFITTFAQGPGRTRHSTGLYTPTGIAVDAARKCLRGGCRQQPHSAFSPAVRADRRPLPDLVIGQTVFSTNGPNQGGISASTLALSTTELHASSAPGIHCIRCRRESVGRRCRQQPRAAFQREACSAARPPPDRPPTSFWARPISSTSTYIAAGINPSDVPDRVHHAHRYRVRYRGRLFVAESVSTRRGPHSDVDAAVLHRPGGLAASRASIPNIRHLPPISEFQLNVSPGGLFPIGDSIGVADTFNSRMLVFPPVEQWTPNTTYQAAVEVAGQADFNSGSSNRGQPTAAAAIALPARQRPRSSATNFTSRIRCNQPRGRDAAKRRFIRPRHRVLGQDQMNLNAPNLVEGREFNFGSRAASTPVSPSISLQSAAPLCRRYLQQPHPRLSRICAILQPGAKADIVIGQPDFQQSLVNYPGEQRQYAELIGPVLRRPDWWSIRTAICMSPIPATAASCGSRSRSRITRPGALEQADLVLGQSSFTSTKITDATARTMAAALRTGVHAVPAACWFRTSSLNRVLLFPGTLEQPSRRACPPRWSSGSRISTRARSRLGPRPDEMARAISRPIADDRLYVADSGNSRVAIFDHAPTANTGQPAAQIADRRACAARAACMSAP